MGKAKLLQFLGVQLVRPLGLLAQFAILARILGPESFAQFAFFYALAIVLSILSDIGQRQIAFAAMRAATDDAGRQDTVRRARRIKTLGSLVLSLGLAGAGAAGLLPWGEALAMILVSVTVPIADVSAAILRGDARPKAEMLLGVAEQVLLVAILWAILTSATPLGAAGALALFGALGAVRMGGLYLVVQRSVMSAPASGTQAGTPQGRSGLADLRRSLVTAISLGASVGMARLPVLLFPMFLDPLSYSVFAAFFTLFQRSELILGGAIQAGFKRQSGRIGKLVASPMRLVLMGAGLGTALTLPVLLVSGGLTDLYLGAQFAGAAGFAVLAAALQILRFPMFALRTILQYGNRAASVTLIILPAMLACVGLTYLWAPTGWLVALPYALALTAVVGLLLRLAQEVDFTAPNVGASPRTRREP